MKPLKRVVRQRSISNSSHVIDTGKDMISDCHSQDESFTIKGYWWLPGNSQRVAGDLVYDVAELRLELCGGLTDAIIESPLVATPEQNEFPVIHGESLKKVPITILHSFHSKWTPDITTLAVQPGTRKALLSSSLLCQKALVGIHLASPDDGFTSCRIEVPCLETWLGDSPFEFKMDGSGEHVQLDYVRPQNTEYVISDYGYSIHFIRTVKPPSFPGFSPSIEHRAYVDIVPSTPMPLEKIEGVATEFVALLSFLYGGILQSQRMTLFKRLSDYDGSALYYPRPKSILSEYGMNDFVIRYADTKELFQELLIGWFGASIHAKRARRLLLSSELRPSKFLDRQFLRLMAVTEVLARDSNLSSVIAEEEFDKLKEQMFVVIRRELSSNMVDSISIRRHKDGQLPLGSKLSNMLNDLKCETAGLFCLDKNKFIQGIVTSRNYWTHYSKKKRVLQDVDLHWTIRKLSLMLRIILLLKAGVSEDVLQRLVNCHHRLRRDKAVWSTITEEGSPFADTDDD